MPNLCDLGSDGSDVCWTCGRRCDFVCHHCLYGGERTTTYDEACEIEERNMERRVPPPKPRKWIELPCEFISAAPLLTVKIGSAVLRLKEHVPWSKSKKGVVLLKKKLGNTLNDKFEVINNKEN